MSVKEREAELFYIWKHLRGYSGFVEDGVFDAETWEKQRLKITFILKEPNWPTASGKASICENVIHFPNSNHWRTWNNITRWTMALLDGGSFPGSISEEQRIEQVKRVSFMNLKKTGGDGGADMDEIARFADRDAGFLCGQLLLYKPDLLVCCGWDVPGVANLLKEKVLDRCGLPVQDREETEHISWFYTRFPGKTRLTPVVDFLHPSQRGKRYEDWEEWYRWMLEVRELLIPPQLLEEGRPQSSKVPRGPEEV